MAAPSGVPPSPKPAQSGPTGRGQVRWTGTAEPTRNSHTPAVMAVQVADTRGRVRKVIDAEAELNGLREFLDEAKRRIFEVGTGLD